MADGPPVSKTSPCVNRMSSQVDMRQGVRGPDDICGSNSSTIQVSHTVFSHPPPPHTHTCEQVVAFIYYAQMCKEREGERCGAAWPVLGFLLFCVSCWCGPTAENMGREEPSVSKGKC